jgi:hypothetical protein
MSVDFTISEKNLAIIARLSPERKGARPKPKRTDDRMLFCGQEVDGAPSQLSCYTGGGHNSLRQCFEHFD